MPWPYFFSTLLKYLTNSSIKGFPGGSAGKDSACNVGDLGLGPGLGRSPGKGSSYPLQYSGLENSMDSIVRGVAKSRTRLSDFHTFRLLYSGSPCVCVSSFFCKMGTVLDSLPWPGGVSEEPWAGVQLEDRILFTQSSSNSAQHTVGAV